jgi:hypothetical protein
MACTKSVIQSTVKLSLGKQHIEVINSLVQRLGMEKPYGWKQEGTACQMKDMYQVWKKWSGSGQTEGTLRAEKGKHNRRKHSWERTKRCWGVGVVMVSLDRQETPSLKQRSSMQKRTLTLHAYLASQLFLNVSPWSYPQTYTSLCKSLCRSQPHKLSTPWLNQEHELPLPSTHSCTLHFHEARLVFPEWC